MYDVSKLKTDVFGKVLKYISDNLRGQEPPAIPMRAANIQNQGMSPKNKPKAASRQVGVTPIAETSMENKSEFYESKPQSPSNDPTVQ